MGIIVREYRPTGGVDYNRPTYMAEPTVWADLINWHPTPFGLGTGVGWSAMGSEIASSTNGIITHLASMAQSDETLERYACGTKRINRWTGSAWSSIQDANDYTAATTDPLDSAFWSDKRYFAIPVSGAANAISQHAGGASNITRTGGSPNNSRFIRQFGNRLCLWGTFSGSTYQSTKFEFSDLDVATTWSAINRITLDETGDGAAGMESVDQMLVLFKVRSSPVLVTQTGNPDDPFNYDMLPGSLGMVNAAAMAKAGHKGVVWVGIRNIHMFNGTSFPQDIGTPVLPILFPKLGAASRVLVGYDQRRADREALYFFTNIATNEHDFYPNTVPVVDQYFGYDFLTQSWFRGDSGAAPYAVGNYFVQVGDRDWATPTIIGTNISLASTNGSTIFDLNHSTFGRNSTDFDRVALTPVLHFGDPTKRKRISKVQPIFDFQEPGTLSVELFWADGMGERPRLFDIARDMKTGGIDVDQPWVDFHDSPEARFLQLRFKTSWQLQLQGFWLEIETVDE